MSNRNAGLPVAALAVERAVNAGQFREALTLFNCEIDPGVRDLVAVKLLAATAAARLGDWQQAATLGLEVLEIGRLTEDLGTRMRALNLLGGLAFERGSFDDAEAHLSEALDLAQHLNDQEIAPRILTNLASLAHVQDRVAEALNRYDDAITMYRRTGNDRGLAETYHNIGLVQRQERAWPEANEAMLFARRHALLVAESSLLSLVHLGSAELLLDQNDYRGASEQIDLAAQSLFAVEDVLGEAEYERVRARLALECGDLNQARRHASAGEAAAAIGENPLLEAQCAAVGAAALKRQGAAEAQAKHDQVIDTLTKMGATQPLERIEREWAGAC